MHCRTAALPMHPARWVSFLATSIVALAMASPARAQLTTPPSGDNQHSRVEQGLGLVSIVVDYNSPNVHAPDGTDRRGKIWGELVPYGMANLGFGTCGDQCPWRGGANQNTVFTTSHDIKVQGQPLAAGAYGLHFVPGKDEWTVIFSKDSTSWGSYTYDPKEDALRVTAKPEKHDYREWLTYEFTDRQLDQATLALQWEELAVPVAITVDGAKELYVEKLRQELRNAPGFESASWAEAATFLLNNDLHPDLALTWARNGVGMPGIGQESFATLSARARAEEKNGLLAEAAATRNKAWNHPSAGPLDLHQAGRQLLGQKKAQDALALFQLNARRHPKQWPVEVGLARGYSAVGNYKEALKHARLAAAQAPDPMNKKSMEDAVVKLEQGKDIN